jgi:hypothetical protein
MDKKKGIIIKDTKEAKEEDELGYCGLYGR